MPCDPDDLRRVAGDLQRDVAALSAEIHAKTLLIEKLKMQLAVLRQAQFGRSSEKLDREVEQLELLIDDIEETEGEKEAQAETTKVNKTEPLLTPRYAVIDIKTEVVEKHGRNLHTVHVMSEVQKA